MDRKNRILKHELFLKCYQKNEEYEKEREFCHHDIVHFLDVARLGMILNEKEKLGVGEENIYAAALLHDIGRFRQYEDGTPHEQASAVLRDAIHSGTGLRRLDHTLGDVFVSVGSLPGQYGLLG